MRIIELIISGVIRILWPLSFFFLHPFVVHVVSYFTDGIDFTAWLIFRPEDRDFYHRWDKTFDLYYYIVAFTVLCIFYNQLWYGKWMIPLLVYRSIGNVIFIVTVDPILTVIFPNAFSVAFAIFSGFDFLNNIRYFHGTSRWLRRRVWLQWIIVILSIVLVLIIEIVRFRIIESDLDNGKIRETGNSIQCFYQRFLELIVLILAGLYIGLTTFPDFEPGTVVRNRWGFFHKTGKRSKNYNPDYDPWVAMQRIINLK